MMSNLQDGDEISIHGEGHPFIIGPSCGVSPYSLRPFELATLLVSLIPPNKGISITLMTCNSATNFHGSNYAKDLSDAFYHFFRYEDILITGFNAFVVVKKNAKFTAASKIGTKLEKGAHCSLDKAAVTYINGASLIKTDPIIRTMSPIAYSWADDDIRHLDAERKMVDITRPEEETISPKLSTFDDSFFSNITEIKSSTDSYVLPKSNSSDSFFRKING